MNTLDDDRSVCGARKGVEQGIEQHWQAMHRACYRILGNATDAEDATNEAVLKVLGNLPDTRVENLQAWLCKVAQNAARDQLRKTKGTRDIESRAHRTHIEMRDDPFRVSQIGMDTRLLLERVTRLLGEPFREDVGLYLDVLLENLTERQLADRVGIPLNTLKTKRRRAREAVQKAATVVCLTTDPGEHPNRCLIPLSLARNKEDSPELLRVVQTHIDSCPRCQGRQKDPTSLVGIVLSIPGLALVGNLLNRVLTTPTRTKLAAAAGAGVVSLVVLILATSSPESGRAMPTTPTTQQPPGRTEAEPAPTSTPPSAPATPPGQVIEKVAPPSASPTAVPPAPVPTIPAATTAVPSGQGGSSRGDGTPAITSSWVEHRRIAAADDGTCDDKPTSSAVRVTVEPGVASAVILLTVRGRTVSLPMWGTGNRSTWDGQVGPVPDDDARGSLGIAVRVVGTNGTHAVKQLGDVCISPCRSGRAGH